MQEQGRKRNEKSYGKVNWGHTLVPDYTRSHWLFVLFLVALCVPTVAKLAGSAGAQVNVDSRASSGPGKLTLHLPGGLPSPQIQADSR